MNRDVRRKVDLLWLLTEKEITLRYKRTSLGILWSLLNPILFALVLSIAFKVFMRFGTENYTFFLLSALFPWTWFATSVTISTGTLINNIGLIKKVLFPRYLLILAMALGQLIHFLFAIPILVGLAYVHGIGPGIEWFIGIPLLIVIQLMIIVGISLALSMANAFFRDLEYIIMVLLNLLFWMTPVIYPLDTVPEIYRSYLMVNPLLYVITAWRSLLMSNSLEWPSIGASFVASLVFLLLGLLVFQRLNKTLDEIL